MFASFFLKFIHHQCNKIYRRETSFYIILWSTESVQARRPYEQNEAAAYFTMWPFLDRVFVYKNIISRPSYFLILLFDGLPYPQRPSGRLDKEIGQNWDWRKLTMQVEAILISLIHEFSDLISYPDLLWTQGRRQSRSWYEISSAPLPLRPRGWCEIPSSQIRGET